MIITTMTSPELWRKSAEALLSPIIARANSAFGKQLYLRHNRNYFDDPRLPLKLISEFSLVKRRSFWSDSVVGRFDVTYSAALYKALGGALAYVDFWTPHPRHGFKAPQFDFKYELDRPDNIFVSLVRATTGKSLVAVTVEGQPCFIEERRAVRTNRIQPGQVFRACTA